MLSATAAARRQISLKAYVGPTLTSSILLEFGINNYTFNLTLWAADRTISKASQESVDIGLLVSGSNCRALIPKLRHSDETGRRTCYTKRNGQRRGRVPLPAVYTLIVLL